MREYRLINTVIKMNEVILKDANLLPSINEFSEEFTGYITALLVDFFSEYN